MHLHNSESRVVLSFVHHAMSYERHEEARLSVSPSFGVAPSDDQLHPIALGSPFMLHDMSFARISAFDPSSHSSRKSTPTYGTGRRSSSRSRSSVLHRLRASVSSVLFSSEFSPTATPKACTPPSSPVPPETLQQYTVPLLEPDLIVSSPGEIHHDGHGISTTEEIPCRYIDPVLLQYTSPGPLTPPDSLRGWKGGLIWREPAHYSSYERQLMGPRLPLDPYSLESLEDREPIADDSYSTELTLTSGELPNMTPSLITSEDQPWHHFNVEEEELQNEKDCDALDDDATVRIHISPAIELTGIEEDRKGKAAEYPAEVCRCHS